METSDVRKRRNECVKCGHTKNDHANTKTGGCLVLRGGPGTITERLCWCKGFRGAVLREAQAAVQKKFNTREDEAIPLLDDMTNPDATPMTGEAAVCYAPVNDNPMEGLPWNEDFPEPEWRRTKESLMLGAGQLEKFRDPYEGTRKHDSVERPEHYTHSRIEVWDAIDAWGLGYRLGNVVKYVARADRKGNALEDLRKARAYLDREIATRQQDARDW